MMDFRKLKVWEKAHLLTLKIYKVTEKFPREELYGLIHRFEELVFQYQQILQKDV